MKVNIVGAGAVGLLLGTFLLERDFEVTFIVRNTQQRKEMLEHGISVRTLDGKSKDYKGIQVSNTLTEDVQLVIVCTKYEHLRNVWPLLETAENQTEFIFIQNGLSHYKDSLQKAIHNITFGSAQFGAERLNYTTVVHRGVGVLKLATARGKNDFVNVLLQLKNSSFPVEWQEDAFNMLFEKALLNCFINPLTTVLKVQNGALIRNKHAFSILGELYNELMHAFPQMKDSFPFELVKGLCEKTDANTSSMLADHLAGRKSEIDAIAGEVIQLAQENGHALPILTTLYHLVKAHEGEGD